MTTTTVMIGLVIGLATGWAARAAASDGGHGLAADLGLGIAGSAMGSAVFWFFSADADTRAVAMAIAAIAGASTAIFAQRHVWAAPTVLQRVPRARR
jgi:uncharacterized membrane protein YeaQ/YmgE (transglycosylase-associated protein family)